MKLLPYVTVASWLLLLSGLFFIPQIMANAAIKYSLLVFLSICLPASIWEFSLQKKRLLAALFLCILFVNCGYLTYWVFHGVEYARNLEPGREFVTDNAKADALLKGSGENYRESYSSEHYILHGSALPFKNAAGGFEVYHPTKADEIAFHNKRSEYHRMVFNSKVALISVNENLFTLLLHLLLFVAVLSLIVIYEGHTRKT